MANATNNQNLYYQQQAIDDAVRAAKQAYADAAAKGDRAGMAAAHATAEAERAKASTIGYTTYSADKDTLDYAINYSPGESTSRPPSWMDWDDDGKVDTNVNGNIYDASGNKLNTTNSQGYTVADWYVNPNDWVYKGANSGGQEKNGTVAVTATSASTGQTTTLYIPSQPSAPAAPPQAPPEPGAEPTFTQEGQVQVTKYEYIYGLKDLQIRGNEYQEKSIYVSKPIQLEGNVMQVSLTSVEDHPVFDMVTGEAATRQTSVEYYVSYVENPASEDWHAILPEDQKTVKSELLIFDDARTATLRFAALTYEATTLYKDGIKFDNWSFAAGGTKIQLLVDRVVGSKYTIDYTPNAEISNPWIIDIYEKGLKVAKMTETFVDGTNHNKTINLSRYPYIDYENINLDGDFDPNTGYRPIVVTLKNATIAGPNRTTLKQVDPYASGLSVYTKNITDYKTKEWKVPQAYNLTTGSVYTVFEYWNEGNKLYFSETFNKSDILTNQEFNHGNAEVQVEYEYLVSNFRIKIILRRNGMATNSVTPSVLEYSLKFKAMK